eukprot:GEMP01093583.1.p1 GENE.GEMP01093583.1~~GEMP01093583.1.p1  ORF type:complete len:225 (+),score=37.79 GEMP01093583.1:61-735(+)
MEGSSTSVGMGKRGQSVVMSDTEKEPRKRSRSLDRRQRVRHEQDPALRAKIEKHGKLHMLHAKDESEIWCRALRDSGHAFHLPSGQRTKRATLAILIEQVDKAVSDDQRVAWKEMRTLLLDPSTVRMASTVNKFTLVLQFKTTTEGLCARSKLIKCGASIKGLAFNAPIPFYNRRPDHRARRLSDQVEKLTISGAPDSNMEKTKKNKKKEKRVTDNVVSQQASA